MSSAAKPGQEVTCRAEVRVVDGKCSTHVVRLEVTDPAGQLRAAYTDNLLAPAGRARHTFTLALGDPTGTWQVRAVDVMSGKTAGAQFEVK